MGIHPFLAETAPTTGGNKGDEYFVPFMKTRYVRSDLLDHPYSFMTENTSSGDCRHVTLENMQVGPADSGRSDPYDSVRCMYDLRLWPIFQCKVIRPMEDKGFHSSYVIFAITNFRHRLSFAKSGAK